MAGNFWQSSHFQEWLLEKQDLMRERNTDLQVLTEEEYQKLMIFWTNFIQVLGEYLNVRQQVISTAFVYFKRFYLRNSFKCVDPLLMAPTCCLLASKVEEFGGVTNTRLITGVQTIVKTKYSHTFPQEFPYRINHVLECEFFLLELMDCCLILYHPYRPLLRYVQDLKEIKELKEFSRDSKDELLSTAWNVVNDTYRSDIPLLYPPHLIAIACLHMGCVICGKDYKQWFAELNVDLDKVLDITRQILNLYEMWKNFDENEMRSILAKMPKPKTQPSRVYSINGI
ncbi:cyclin C isoform X2 [Brevipalpus obovatus]|uniref:cyclin C isoform X2 n=1 Tax=Brevipalpus obovatus TaxID=246614 RepID=UPI003D9EC854